MQYNYVDTNELDVIRCIFVNFATGSSNTSSGVIIFGSDQEVGELMMAVRRRNSTGLFSWIGSDGWGGRGLAYQGKEAEVRTDV